MADVYNLHVEDVNEFYANGVLVHNSDALAMTFMLDWQVDGERLSAGSDVDLGELDPGLEEDYAKKQARMSLDFGRGSDMAPYRASRWGKIRSRR